MTAAGVALVMAAAVDLQNYKGVRHFDFDTRMGCRKDRSHLYIAEMLFGDQTCPPASKKHSSITASLRFEMFEK